MSLKALTYNIHKGFSRLNLRDVLQEIKKSLQSTQADILFLQEVSGHPEPQFEVLADQFWPHFSYGRNAIYEKGDHGNAILSKFPILSMHNQDISLSGFEKRGLLHCEIELPNTGRRLDLFNTHLNLRHADRIKQIQQVCHFVRANSDPSRPLIFAGDFNDWNQQLSKHLENELSLSEAFVSFEGGHAKSFPNFLPFLKLDRIYYRHLDMLAARRFSGKPWNNLSDHLALMAEFDF